MPLFYSVFGSHSRSMSLYCTEMPKSKAQVHATQSLIDEDKGESSDLAAAKSKYEMLPHYLRSCLDYLCMLSPLYTYKNKKPLIQLLIAENLIPEKSGEILEDIAANIIDELVALGMIKETPYVISDRIVVSEMYKKICLFKVEQDFVNESKNSPIYAVIIDDSPPDNFKSFSIQSLFIKGKINGAFFRTIFTFQFMVALDLWWANVDYLPDEVGDLVNLRYLGLGGTEVEEIPSSIGNLQKLQTLNIRCIGLRQLPIEILNIKQLRHLVVFPRVRVPKGIGSLVNLHTWTGVLWGPDIASELSKLTQLRELNIQDVSVIYAEEIFVVIMKMENLVFLSLRAEQFYDDVMDKGIYLFPDLELFCLPPHLQDLRLDGGLVEIPKWLSSMENLTNLRLYHSNLLENPFSILQCIPKLKHLHLWNTYNARCIGKEFCDAGGFPSLEFLSIRSEYLIEWTEIVDGAFPNLRILAFYFCHRLMFLPEGLQYITTLENLYFKGMHGELMRKLKDKENCKIKHIPKVIELDSWSC